MISDDIDDLTPHEKYELAIKILANKLIRFHIASDWFGILKQVKKDVFAKAYAEIQRKTNEKQT